MKDRLKRKEVKAAVKTPRPGTGVRSPKQRPRQAITPWALVTRLRDSGIAEVQDTRAKHLVVHAAGALMLVLTLGMAKASSSMRGIELMTKTLGRGMRELIGLKGPVSDTALYEFFRHLLPSDLVGRLRRLVLAEWQRGGLRPQVVPFSTVAFDGKKLITYHHAQVRALAERIWDGPLPESLDVDLLKLRFAVHYPEVKLVRENPKSDRVHGYVMSHRATLVSHPAAPCMALEVLPGSANEVGHAPGFVKRLLNAYRKTGLIELVTADAGNCSREISECIIALGSHYFLALKDNQPEACAEARRWLEETHRPADTELPAENEKGKRIVRRVWVTDARGLLERFPDAAQLIRVQRVVQQLDGTYVSEGNRYFVTSMPSPRMSPQNAGVIARMHWRCENLGHWTADVFFREDRASRTPLTRTPALVGIAATLRAIAQSIVSILRAGSRGPTKKSPLPSWTECIEHVARCLVGAVRIRLTVESTATN